VLGQHLLPVLKEKRKKKQKRRQVVEDPLNYLQKNHKKQKILKIQKNQKNRKRNKKVCLSVPSLDYGVFAFTFTPLCGFKEGV
jgi:hypothetical protein